MEATIAPLLGPLHLRSPRWNAVSVRDALAAWGPDVLALAPLPPGALDDGAGPAWLGTDEIALPLAVVPWARARGLRLACVGEPQPDPEAEADLRRYLSGYPAARSRMDAVDALLRPVRELLERPLDPERIGSELLPALRAHQEAREEAFGDGPATGWLRARADAVAARVAELAAGGGRIAVLASAEEVPLLRDALAGRGVDAPLLPPAQPGPEARERAELDLAFRGDAPDPAALLARLREIGGAEAAFHAAGLLLAHGHAAEALERLEEASRGDFSRPWFLPGYLLARLGQLRDLDGRREDAKRAYRGVLALDWAPPEAVEAARAGLEAPFALPGGEGEGEGEGEGGA